MEIELKEVSILWGADGRVPSAKHPDIKEGQLYLVKYDEGWYVGRFSKVWFGWSFNGWYAHLGLNNIDHKGDRIFEFHPIDE